MNYKTMPKLQIVCTDCAVSVSSQTALGRHMRTAHGSTAPHACTKCPRTFKHKHSLVRHEKSSHGESALRPTIHVAPINRRFGDLGAYRLYLIAPFDSFEAWARSYQQHRLRDDASLSESTAQNIQSTFTLCFARLDLDWEDPDAFNDTVDDWLDEMYRSSLQPVTIVNRLRHLRWWFWYVYTTGTVSPEIGEWLTECIHTTQAAATKRTSNDHCLAMLDPFALARIRDGLVIALRQQQQATLDPFIDRFFRHPGSISSKECIAFGAAHLRCWIDMAMRFVSVPLRMQCTVHLVEPSYPQTSYVCKLTFRGDRYVRLVYHDKNGDRRQPIEVPVGRTTSIYLAFYRAHCRPRPLEHYTFQTLQGAPWSRASRDVKDYTRDILQVATDTIEPNGRFVHGSRHIMLATYALTVDFDTERMRELAHLMRHSVAVSERYYSVWLERHRNTRAAQQYVSRMLPEDLLPHSLPTPVEMAYTPIPLRVPSTLLVHTLCDQMRGEHTAEYLSVPFETCDQSTQTTDLPVDDTLLVPSLSDSATLPRCRACRTPFVVFGPLGQRRHRRFGCYYCQCRACSGARPATGEGLIVWYPLGYQPSTPTVSQKPRNMGTITDFVTAS